MSSLIFLGDVKVENISYSVEHHENSPCVTLTCVSTGGPATNVTWTKNSVEVVLGKRVTVLSDPVAAKYTHTMTPTGRELEGLYQCTVSNNKPSEDSMQVRVSLNGNRMYRNSAQNDDNHYEDLSQYDDDNRSSSKNYYMYEESLQYDNDNRSSSKTIIEDSLQYDNDNRDSYYNRHMYEYDNDKENSLRNYDRDRTLIIGKGMANNSH